jgi:hypothetical protein
MVCITTVCGTANLDHKRPLCLNLLMAELYIALISIKSYKFVAIIQII